MKTASIILLCLVMLSVIYGYSVMMFDYQIQTSKPASIIEKIDILKSLDIQSFHLQADPIDSPRPKINT